MELYASFNRDKILSAATMEIDTKLVIFIIVVETKLIPTAFRRKDAIGTKICTDVC